MPPPKLVRTMEIQALQEESRHQIAAEQTIQDLACAVQELVANALDAGAKRINVRLFNQGIDIVEVSDDGSGIPKSSRELIAVPHATSKIKSYQDIYTNVSTLGFRGEALFCLANISQQLIVATRTADEELAQKLTFQRDGTLGATEEFPKKVGTTVAIVKLFHHLPVRRKDMIRRIQAQRDRLVRVMEAQAIFSTGVCITLMDIVGKMGKERILLSTPSNSTTIEETISSIHGSKFLSKLCPFRIELMTQDSPLGFVEGFVSDASKPLEVGIKEHQYFAVNGRSVDIPSVVRLLNDIWRTLGFKRTPSCVLEFRLPNSAFDVNLSPDKRKIEFQDQTAIFETIKEEITKVWLSQTQGTFQTQEIDVAEAVEEPIGSEPIESGEESAEKQILPPEIGSPGRFNRRYAFSHDVGQIRLQHQFDDGRESAKKRPARRVTLSKSEREKRQRLDDIDEQEVDLPSSQESAVSFEEETKDDKAVETEPLNLESKFTSRVAFDVNTDADRRQWQQARAKFNRDTEDVMTTKVQNTDKEPPVQKNNARITMSTLEKFGFKTEKRLSSISISERSEEEPVTETTRRRESIPAEVRPLQDRVDAVEKRAPVVWDKFRGTEAVIAASREERLRAKQRRHGLYADLDISELSDDNQAGNIEDIDSNQGNRITLRKEDFGEMKILGQFNMGFILARSADDHLWILDQHACDERYNFEKQMQQTVIHEQTLMSPIQLDLSPSEETCILDNMDIFEKNGFRFRYDETQAPRHRLFLTALPHSGAEDGRKAVQFGKEDVSILCSILSTEEPCLESQQEGGTGVDGSGLYGNNAVRRYISSQDGDNADKLIARLPKAIAMFASRACRNSIMIGKALSPKEMERIVKQLQSIEQPWICAHGRPTMRHIGSIKKTLIEDEKDAAEYMAGPVTMYSSQLEHGN